MATHNSIRCIHHLPGRIRLRVETIRENAHAASAVEKRLRRARGIHSVHANPLTGSVLIGYDPARASSSSILAALDFLPPAAPRVHHTLPVAIRVAERVAPVLAQKAIEIALERAVMLLIAAVL